MKTDLCTKDKSLRVISKEDIRLWWLFEYYDNLLKCYNVWKLFEYSMYKYKTKYFRFYVKPLLKIIIIIAPKVIKFQ
jgi:hypothetical protein